MIANAGVAVNRVLHESASSPSLPAVLCSRTAAPTSELDRMLDVNVKGTFFSYKHAAVQLLKQGTGGRMVGAASVASKRGASGAVCRAGAGALTQRQGSRSTRRTARPSLRCGA